MSALDEEPNTRGTARKSTGCEATGEMPGFCAPLNYHAPRLSLAALLLLSAAAWAGELSVARLEPTPLFPRPANGAPLRQTARLHLENRGQPTAATARITVGSTESYTQDLGQVVTGESSLVVGVTDIARPTPVVIEVLSGADGSVLARQELTWQPQRKWRVFRVGWRWSAWTSWEMSATGIPVQHGLRVDCRVNGAWHTAAQIHDAAERTIQARWPAVIETDALRLYVPASDLPKSTIPGIPDGVVRVCELVLVLPDGRKTTVPDLFGH